jgi:hypothetical protein
MKSAIDCLCRVRRNSATVQGAVEFFTLVPGIAERRELLLEPAVRSRRRFLRVWRSIVRNALCASKRSRFFCCDVSTNTRSPLMTSLTERPCDSLTVFGEIAS